MTNRKFHRTTITATILSEEPYEPQTLGHVHYDMIEGDVSGEWEVTNSEEIDGKTAADALLAQASDPGFFNLTVNGEDFLEDGKTPLE